MAMINAKIKGTMITFAIYKMAKNAIKPIRKMVVLNTNDVLNPASSVIFIFYF